MGERIYIPGRKLDGGVIQGTETGLGLLAPIISALAALESWFLCGKHCLMRVPYWDQWGFFNWRELIPCRHESETMGAGQAALMLEVSTLCPTK